MIMTQGPKHIAFIMDGNRRWAKERGLSTAEGHQAGFNKLKDVLQWCWDRQVASVTVFAFSTENWKRSEEEVGFLMGLFERILRDELAYFKEKKTRLRVLGQRERLSTRLQQLILDAEKATENDTDHTVGICLNYGGRHEILDATKSLVAKGMTLEDITEERFAKELYWSAMPDPDLIVRTSGEQRLSGFLLWQSAYSELMFIDEYWPAMSEEVIERIFQEYHHRQRRYGA